jgi:hypothetical protein
VKYGFDTPEGIKPEDVEKAARELHEIQERWKQAAEAPAQPGPGVVASISAGRRSDPGKGAGVLSRCGSKSGRKPRAEARAHRASRGGGELDRLDQRPRKS